MRLKPNEVHYLSFEGGGGRGVVYLGAIEALTKKKILPIDFDKPQQIKGISGASAGAITALLLAMGFSLTELRKLLGNPEVFNKFYDSPRRGVYRTVNAGNEPAIHKDPESLVNQRIKQLVSAVRAPKYTAPLQDLASGFVGSAVSDSDKQRVKDWFESFAAFGILGLLLSYLLAMFLKEDAALVKQFESDRGDYVYNLIFDRGMFPGLAVRDFFDKLISSRLEAIALIKDPNNTSRKAINGGGVSFLQFYGYTGVDLVVTGTNVTTHRSHVFSMRNTPNFPVAEAVAISMNIPFLFKPIYVEAKVPKNSTYLQDPDDYKGYWVDGGLLNNLPIHAFDDLLPPVSEEHPHLRPLHPNMLGIRLEPLTKKAKHDVWSILRSYGGDVLDSWWSPAESGQIRTPQEECQTITLDTDDLDMTDFAPPASKTGSLITAARNAVLGYFGEK